MAPRHGPPADAEVGALPQAADGVHALPGPAARLRGRALRGPPWPARHQGDRSAADRRDRALRGPRGRYPRPLHPRASGLRGHRRHAHRAAGQDPERGPRDLLAAAARSPGRAAARRARARRLHRPEGDGFARPPLRARRLPRGASRSARARGRALVSAHEAGASTPASELRRPAPTWRLERPRPRRRGGRRAMRSSTWRRPDSTPGATRSSRSPRFRSTRGG